ncbi:MAG: SxtJ family membrane protein, partial [Leptospirales bacterium]
MNATRKYFFKLLAFTLIVFAVARVWDFAAIWRPYLLGLAGVLLLLAIVPILGRPLHILWEAYLKRTEQGTRFFQGAAVFLFVIAYYRLRHVAGVNLSPLDASSLPAGDYRWWALASGVLLMIGVIPPAARLGFAVWMKLAHAIQAVVSRVILTLAFMLVVFPLGLLAKLVGKRFLVRKPDPKAETYWITREVAEWDPDLY